MKNSPWGVIRTHTWSEVKGYVWGNLTVGQNFKTVHSNVKGMHSTKRKSIRVLLSPIKLSVNLATKFIAMIYTTPKEVVAYVSTNPSIARWIKRINSIRNYCTAPVKRFIVSSKHTSLSGLPVTLRQSVKTLSNPLQLFSMKTAKPLKQLFSAIKTNNSKGIGVFNQISTSILNNISRATNIEKNISLLLKNTSSVIRSFNTSKFLSTVVSFAYNSSPVTWLENSTRTWQEMLSYTWGNFKYLQATSISKLTYKRPGYAEVKVKVLSVQNSIKRQLTGILKATATLGRDVLSVINSKSSTSTDAIRDSLITLQQSTGVRGRVFVMYFKEFVTNVLVNVKGFLLTSKAMRTSATLEGSFLSRFGRAVIQKINAVAVHSLNIALSVIKSDKVKMFATHKVKQEVIWRMGANARGETLHMVLGETKVIELTVVNEDGTPTDLDGAYARFAISGTVEKECGIEDNKIKVMIEPNDIENAGTYDYEFRLKDIFNRIDSLIIGKVIVEPKIVSAY